MLTYVMVVASVALLGLFVDENRLSLSIKLAVLYGGLYRLRLSGHAFATQAAFRMA
ncbi:MAG: hypothetical protein KGZ43_06825 [Sulfuritalea sp.]|nr:hypothetical protein [Sulfuritalea sp.]